MAVDTSNAFVVGGTSAVVCYGLAYLIFKKFISNNYGKGREGQSGVYYWCGFIALISFGHGLGTIVNELIFSVLTGASVRQEIVERGVFPLVAFPAFVAFIAFLIAKVTGDKSQINQPSFERFEGDKPSAKPPVSTNGVLLIIAAAVLLAYIFIPTSIFNIGNGKTLLISGCEVCCVFR